MLFFGRRWTVLVAAAHHLGIFGKERTVQFVVDVYNATVRDVQTDMRIHLPSNGNPDVRYSELTAQSKQDPTSKNLKSLEGALIKRIQSKLGNQLRNLEKTVVPVLCQFFTNPVVNPYYAKVLGVHVGTKLWPRSFTNIDGGYLHFGPDYQEFWNNFHTWDLANDKSLQLGSHPSNGVISFFVDPPERTIRITKTEGVVFSPLFMILFELVLSNWSRLGARMLVPEEDLIQGPDHARKCAETLLKATYPSMNPVEEKMSAENFYVPDSDPTDPHLVINPSIFAFVFMLLKGFGNGKTLSGFLRDDYIGISRQQRLPPADMAKLKETEEDIEELFRINFAGLRASYTTHFVSRAIVAVKEAPGNRMYDGANLDEDEEDSAHNSSDEKSGVVASPIASASGRVPKNPACSFGQQCAHVDDEDPPVMFTCSNCYAADNKAHKICAQRCANEHKDELPVGWMHQEFEAMSFKVCKECIEGKCLILKDKGPAKGAAGAHKMKLKALKKELGILLRNSPTRKIFVF